MIIIDQWNKTTLLYEIQVTVIYSRAILFAVTSEYGVKRVDWDIGKQWKSRSDATEHCLLK